MIKKLNILLLSLLCFGFFFEGCGNSNASVKNGGSPEQTTASSSAVSSKSNELEVWTTSDWSEFTDKFKSENKGVNIKIKTFDYSSSNKEFIKALSSGTGPDILEMNSDYFGQYAANGILEDLLKAPYNAGKYEKYYSKDVWESNMSIDNKGILGITRLTAPNLTLYRADIMQQNGFPSDPEELGRFIEKPENLLAIGKKLKSKDQYIFQWNSDIANLFGKSIGIFDKDLNYIRNNDLIVKSLVIAREVHKLGLESEIGFWTDDGKKAVQSSKLVMLHNVGPWEVETLKSCAPDQKGKWRAAKPALGTSGWSSDLRMCINAQSKNKKLAWKFIEFVSTYNYRTGYMVPGYIPARKNSDDLASKEEYLGGQALRLLCEDQVNKMKQFKITPLDDKAEELYIKQLYDTKYTNKEASKAVAEMAKDVESEISEEKQALLMQIKDQEN